MATAITVEQMRNSGPEFIEATSAWCRANGIDPNEVSARYAVAIVGERIQYHAFYVSEDGKRRRVVDYTGPEDEIATVFREVDLVVPMPEVQPTAD